jgi:hypothetical protein
MTVVSRASLALLVTSQLGCAMLRLNGCSKLAVCEALTVYACGDDVVCADADGNTVHAESLSPSRNFCHICAE